MADTTKELAAKLVEEVRDSAHLFFAPVRVIVREFGRAVSEPPRNTPTVSKNSDPHDDCRAHAG